MQVLRKKGKIVSEDAKLSLYFVQKYGDLCNDNKKQIIKNL